MSGAELECASAQSGPSSLNRVFAGSSVAGSWSRYPLEDSFQIERDSTRTPMSTARGCWACDYAFNRYRREAERHCQVLNNSFEGRDYIVGNGYTLVDMSA
jgi:glutathione S-transferase